MRRVLWVAIAVALVVLFIMPIFLQNEIVQTIEKSSDMKSHLRVIEAINNGEEIAVLYYGQVILAYIMKPIADSEHIAKFYLWFNFAVLIASAFSIYYVTKKLTGKEAALLVIPLAFFCTTGIFALFKYGVIFNIINMYIILPFAIYFAVKWIDDKKWQYSIPAVMLFALFCSLHYTALYLPYAIGCSLAIYAIYAIAKHKWGIIMKYIVPCGVGLVALKILLSINFLGIAGNLPDSTYQLLPIVNFMSLLLLVDHASIVIAIILFLLVCFFRITYRSVLKADKRTMILYIILAGFIVSLFGGLITLATPDFNRIAIDLATMMAIAVACILGGIIRQGKNHAFSKVVVIMLALGSVPSIITWVG